MKGFGRTQSGQGARRAVRLIAVGATAAATLLSFLLPQTGAEAAVPSVRLWALRTGADGRPVVVHTTADARRAYAATADGYEVDTTVSALADPNESQQWALGAGSFTGAWSRTTGAGVTVAVIDTGVRRTHQDLAGAVLPGIDLVTGSGDGSNDQNGHGSHVAGIIAARRNGVGGVGGAPSATILPIRVLDANGSGYTSNVAEGIVYAADHGARVVNLSLGGPQASNAMQDAIRYARSKGVVVMAAAGNYGQQGNPTIYPAAYPEATAVAAVDNRLQHADFSETGAYVDLAAPGVNIVSAWGTSDNAYAWASGTSMATPYASAAAALVLAAHPTFSATQVISQLTTTATDLGAAGKDSVYGAGLVNPALAVQGGSEGSGYWVVGSNGRVRTAGSAKWFGDLRNVWMTSPIVASSRTVSGQGYWLTAADGRVFPFGDAKWYGDMGGKGLWSPIVAMATTPSGKGYWLLASDGGVFSFGDAHFYGSTGGMRLSARVLDLTPTATGKGYWFVAADGGVFAYGDAKFRGSAGGLRLWQPVISMTAAASGRGYWLVARDGGIFAYGVPFHGSLASMGASTLHGSGVRIRAFASGRGYYILTDSGTAYPFGSARNYGLGGGLGAPAVDLMLAS